MEGDRVDAKRITGFERSRPQGIQPALPAYPLRLPANFRISANDNLGTIDLGGLVTASELGVGLNPALEVLHLDALTEVDGSLWIIDNDTLTCDLDASPPLSRSAKR